MSQEAQFLQSQGGGLTLPDSQGGTLLDLLNPPNHNHCSQEGLCPPPPLPLPALGATPTLHSTQQAQHPPQQAQQPPQQQHQNQHQHQQQQQQQFHFAGSLPGPSFPFPVFPPAQDLAPVLDINGRESGTTYREVSLEGLAGPLPYGSNNKAGRAKSPGGHPSIQKIEHRGSKASRRGPMDEMRQLVRILVKFIPQSADVLNTSLENGGGNRVSEEQIKKYLCYTLGEEAPQPEWGLPDGWGQYLSEMLCWALDRPITRDQAMNCARRQQGRSWEIVESAVRDLDVYSYAWPVPLTLAGIRAAQANPGMPSPGSGFLAPTHTRRSRPLPIKRQQPDDGHGGGGRKTTKRDGPSHVPSSNWNDLKGSNEFAHLSAQDCLTEALKFVQAGSTKMQNRGPKDSPESFESLWSLLSSILAARPHPMLASMAHMGHMGSMPMGMGGLGLPGLEGMSVGANPLGISSITGGMPPLPGSVNMMSMGLMGSMNLATMGGSMGGLPPMPLMGGGIANSLAQNSNGVGFNGSGLIQAGVACQHPSGMVPLPCVSGRDVQPNVQPEPAPSMHKGTSDTRTHSNDSGDTHSQDCPSSTTAPLAGGAGHATRSGTGHPTTSSGRLNGLPPLQSNARDELCRSAEKAPQGSAGSSHPDQAVCSQPVRKQQRTGYSQQGRSSRGGSEAGGTGSAQEGPYRDQLSVLALAASEQRRQDMMGGEGRPSKAVGGGDGNGPAVGGSRGGSAGGGGMFTSPTGQESEGRPSPQIAENLRLMLVQHMQQEQQ